MPEGTSLRDERLWTAGGPPPSNWDAGRSGAGLARELRERRASPGLAGDHEYGDATGALRPAGWRLDLRYEDKGERIKR